MSTACVQPFLARVRHQPGVTIIDLEGEIDMHAEMALQQAYMEGESHSAHLILLNFRRVTSINTAGIALLRSLQSRSRQLRHLMLVHGLKSRYVELCQLTCLIDFMGIGIDEATISA